MDYLSIFTSKIILKNCLHIKKPLKNIQPKMEEKHIIDVSEDKLIKMFCCWLDFVMFVVILRFLKFIICYSFFFHVKQIFTFTPIFAFIILDSIFKESFPSCISWKLHKTWINPWKEELYHSQFCITEILTKKLTTSGRHVLLKDSFFYDANSMTRVSNKQHCTNPTGPQITLRSFLGQISLLWLNSHPRSQIARLKKSIDMFQIIYTSEKKKLSFDNCAVFTQYCLSEI